MTNKDDRDYIEGVILSNRERSGAGNTVVSLLASVPGKWELILKIIFRDVSARYRQSFLGYLWALIMPLAALGIFSLISKYRILPMGQLDMPYILFGVWSLSVWQLFTNTLKGCTNSLANAGPLVTKLNFPKDVLVLSAVGQPVIEFLIRAVFVIALFLFYRYAPGFDVIWVPLILVSIILLSVGMGFFLSIANLLTRDVGNIVTLATVIGIFLAPVMYPAPVRWPFTIVNYINPVSPLLIATQDLLSGNSLSHPWALLVSTLISISIFILGWKFFLYVLPRAIERA
jgi:lipopolysaccharide transport system permease protein